MKNIATISRQLNNFWTLLLSSLRIALKPILEKKITNTFYFKKSTLVENQHPLLELNDAEKKFSSSIFFFLFLQWAYNGKKELISKMQCISVKFQAELMNNNTVMDEDM